MQWRLRVATGTVLIALVVPLFGAVEADPPDSVEAWNAGWIDGDAARLGAMYSENAQVLTPFAPPIQGREEIEAMFVRMMGRNIAISSRVIDEIESGELRVRRCEWRMTISTLDQGVMDMDDGSSLEVWRRVDDDWRLHYQTFFSYNFPLATYGESEPAERDGRPGTAPEADGEPSPPR